MQVLRKEHGVSYQQNVLQLTLDCKAPGFRILAFRRFCFRLIMHLGTLWLVPNVKRCQNEAIFMRSRFKYLLKTPCLA